MESADQRRLEVSSVGEYYPYGNQSSTSVGPNRCAPVILSILRGPASALVGQPLTSIVSLHHLHSPSISPVNLQSSTAHPSGVARPSVAAVVQPPPKCACAWPRQGQDNRVVTQCLRQLNISSERRSCAGDRGGIHVSVRNPPSPSILSLMSRCTAELCAEAYQDVHVWSAYDLHAPPRSLRPF